MARMSARLLTLAVLFLAFLTVLTDAHGTRTKAVGRKHARGRKRLPSADVGNRNLGARQAISLDLGGLGLLDNIANLDLDVAGAAVSSFHAQASAAAAAAFSSEALASSFAAVASSEAAAVASSSEAVATSSVASSEAAAVASSSEAVAASSVAAAAASSEAAAVASSSEAVAVSSAAAAAASSEAAIASSTQAAAISSSEAAASSDAAALSAAAPSTSSTVIVETPSSTPAIATSTSSTEEAIATSTDNPVASAESLLSPVETIASLAPSSEAQAPSSVPVAVQAGASTSSTAPAAQVTQSSAFETSSPSASQSAEAVENPSSAAPAETPSASSLVEEAPSASTVESGPIASASAVESTSTAEAPSAVQSIGAVESAIAESSSASESSAPVETISNVETPGASQTSTPSAVESAINAEVTQSGAASSNVDIPVSTVGAIGSSAESIPASSTTPPMPESTSQPESLTPSASETQSASVAPHDSPVSSQDPIKPSASESSSPSQSQESTFVAQPSITIESSSELVSGTAVPASSAVISSSHSVSPPSVTESVTASNSNLDSSASGSNFASASSDSPSASASAFPSASPSASNDYSYSEESSSSISIATSTINNAYTPSQTYLIVAQTEAASSASYSAAPSTEAPSSATGSPTQSLPATATIPNSVPTLIVPADSVKVNTKAGTGEADDPVKNKTLISFLLDGEGYPWLFVVNSSDATSQLLNTFPTLIAAALNISESEVSTYGLQAYQPASWKRGEAQLLTTWLGYIPSDQFENLNSYLKTPGSPLFSQDGLRGQLASQINTAFPLAAANSGSTSTNDMTTSSGGNSTRTRDAIIGVCVGVGGIIWIALILWIYRRVKRNNERTVHKRLSEHMSMFSSAASGYGAAGNRHSRSSSIAASEIDDRPSSFYASPTDNDRSMRERRHTHITSISRPWSGEEQQRASPSHGPSIFGTSWFQNPSEPNNVKSRASTRYPAQHTPGAVDANPFENIVTRSYLDSTAPSSPSMAAYRRSALHSGGSNPKRLSPVAVNKQQISVPTLQANSLEFTEHRQE